MRSGKNNFQKVVRLIIDVLNVIFGIAAIVLTILYLLIPVRINGCSILFFNRRTYEHDDRN